MNNQGPTYIWCVYMCIWRTQRHYNVTIKSHKLIIRRGVYKHYTSMLSFFRTLAQEMLLSTATQQSCRYSINTDSIDEKEKYI